MNVFDTKKGGIIGQLVDVTTDGIKLSAEKPVDVGAVFKLKMVLPDGAEKNVEIQFKAICIWCEREYDSKSWQIGFKFTDISSKEIALIEKSLAAYLL